MCLAPRAAPARVAASVVRQAPPDSAEPPARSRLFDAAEPLDLRLTADFGAIAKQRGTEKKAQPGVLSYVTPAGDSVKLDVQLSTRGHFRLARCQYPPLKITFDKAQKALNTNALSRDSSGIVYPVPEDFNWCGKSSTPYPQPDVRLPIQTERQRTFRGTCRVPEELALLFAQLPAQKDSIYALYRGLESEGLEPKRVKQALDYYDEFYKTISNPGDTRREFTRTCKER